MPLSANTVFHFTTKKDDLIGILQSNFQVYYCFETIFIGNRPMEIYVPMVSFCDIPLSEIKPHIKSYGPYGIGLSKEWAIRSRLNPVLYVEKGSFLSQSLVKFTTDLVTNTATGPQSIGKAFFDIMRYMKNYQGPLNRKGNLIHPDYRFSDEREWRYVPEYTKQFPMLLMKGAHDTLIPGKDQLVSAEKLVFVPNDIKYVIIEKETERTDFISILRAAKTKYSLEDVDRLTSRILTKEQIEEDI